tara:strand:+ start:1348 stop:1548 length:201 start_codon:yes stop_codon:yes gene_type:complete
MIEFKTYEEAQQYCDDNANLWDCGCGCGQYSEVEYEIQGASVVRIQIEVDMEGHVEEDEEVIGVIV